MRIKIKNPSITPSDPEDNLTEDKVYDVLTLVDRGGLIYAIILDDNNAPYVTRSPINGQSPVYWQLVSVTAESSEQLYPPL